MPTTTTTRGNAGRWGAVRYADVTHPAVRALRPLAFRLWVLLHTYTVTIRDGVPHLSAWQVGTRRLADDLGVEGEDKDRRKTVRRAAQELVDAGLLSIEARHASGGADAWHSYSLRRPTTGCEREGGTDAAREGGTGAAREGGTDAAREGGTGAAPHTPKNTPQQQIPPNPPKGGDSPRPRVERLRHELLSMLDAADARYALSPLAEWVATLDPWTGERLYRAAEDGRLLEAADALADDIREATGQAVTDAMQYAEQRARTARARIQQARDQVEAAAASGRLTAEWRDQIGRAVS